MLRDVFYYGAKPNVHPREQYAENLEDARRKATTRDFWIINEFCDYRNFDWDFDFEFLPDEDVWAEDHNNVWPSQHQKDSGTWLCPKEHSDLIIYRGDVDPVIRKNEKQSENWVELDLIDHTKFDFSWHPDPTDPPYIYKWGCKFFPAELKHVLEYRVPGATQEKYMSTTVELLPQTEFWVEHQEINKHKFDMSWRPNPLDPPFIYIWGNKYVDGKLQPTLEYHAPNATDKKYMPEKLEVLPEWDKWVEVQAVDKSKFDFSWRPDPREPAYIYTWGNKYIEAELKPTLEYHCEGATERKYMTNDVVVLPEYEKWKIIEEIEKDSFDFSWRPDPREPDLIYVFGNQYYDAVKMPTLEYHCEGATERKYMDSVFAKLAPNPKLFEHLEDSYLEDYSWHPDPDSPPYIYVWGNQWNAPEDKISVQFVVEGATEYKYMNERAVRNICMDNWIVPDDVDTTGFDFSWEPSPAAPPFIYEFGTQWQKTGGPKYVVPGATENQYVDFQKVKKLPSRENWTIPNNIDTSGFDFSWHPDDTSPPYVYVFATQWAFSGGPVYTVPGATETKYVDDQTATAVTDMTNWVYDEYEIDVDSFDFSWHPYVEDQPYIYQFGTQWQKTGGPRYITPGADSSSPIKYIDTRILKATRLPNKNDYCWVENYPIENFDYSWHPDDTEEPYIYVFGNNLYPAEEMPTIEYRVPDATKVKFVNDIVATLDTDMTNWEIPDDVDTTGFDFSWKPNPTDPAYIYEFGTQWQKTGGPRYIVSGATETKYLDSQQVTRLSNVTGWTVPKNVDISDFDFSWHPDATDPPYIYQFGTQWALTGGPTYIVSGATEVKYMDEQVAKALPDKTNWVYDESLIDIDNFDFSWHPYVEDQPYVYEFATQWQKTGGPKYITPGADSSSPIKYIDPRIIKSIRIPNPTDSNWKIVNNYKIKEFDFSWHPDNTEEPYIYVFGNNLYPAEECATIEYHVPGATTVKFISDIIATLDVDLTNWEIPENIDLGDFDFSWIPNPNDPPYIYEFGTQWQKTGGPRYIVSGATETKYLDFQKVVYRSSQSGWIIPNNVNISEFDFSWHPDDTDPPYIYQFGTQWALSGGPSYAVSGATEIKYMDEQIATALPDRTNWVYDESLVDIDSFDFSWHPYVEDQPYIYEFGTQWQKTGGPKYITPGADSSSPVKYIDTRILKAKRLPNKDSAWNVVNDYKIQSFDYSWHPDSTDEPYIYVFGNNLYSAEECPTIEYKVKGATAIKYVHDIVATLAVDMRNWEVPANIDSNGFDFSWVPNPNDLPYIYEFGTQWQKTGGPRYIVSGATETKYLDFQKVTHCSSMNGWTIPKNVDISEFDFSWHPDATEPAYIYQFGTQWALSGGPKYVVEGATEVKYMDEQTAKAVPNRTNWEFDETLIDVDSFDFSWHPYVEDRPYIYQFGTQWQKTGGPRYITPGADSNSPVKYIDTRIIKSTRLTNPNDSCWITHYKIKDFDWSWHPDETEEPYIYVFGNTLYSPEECATVEYRVPGATQIKYINDVVATIDVDMTNWKIPKNVKITEFDFGWIPNPNDPPYIYEFGTQWQKTGGPQYVVPGATEIKYINTQTVTRLPNLSCWHIPDYVDQNSFDFSWHPDDTDPPYIYQFGTQWALSGGPSYVVEGAIETKYIDAQVAKSLPNKTNWEFDESLFDVNSFDFSWHPYVEDQPYIYQFGTQWALSGGPSYVVEGAIETKYIDAQIAKSLPNKTNWEFDESLFDVNSFDFSWHPYVEDQPYIYQFGTQWQKTGGPRYVTPGAKVNSPVKYVDTRVIKATRLPRKTSHWKTLGYEIENFDYSWHPDETEEPYIYVFGNILYPAEEVPTVTYTVEGATQFKYVHDIVAKLAPNKTNWKIDIPIDESKWDFSWVPNPNDPPYIYVWGNQWNPAEIEPTIRYIVSGATELKYMNDTVATVLADASRFKLLHPVDENSFDFSWRPNPTDPAYTYVFGNSQYPAEIMPTIEFTVSGATQVKYIHDIVAKLAPNKTNWDIPDNIDVSSFDFSWVPNPTAPAYIYEFATVWNNRGGPKYVVSGATEYKYIEDIKARTLPNKMNWEIPQGTDVSKFDFSWVPHPLAPPYIYQFGTKLDNNDGPRYITPGNTGEVVYMERVETEEVSEIIVSTYYIETTLEDLVKQHPGEVFWALRKNIDYTDFDFMWRPGTVEVAWELEYVHVFGSMDSELTQTYFVSADHYLEGNTSFKFAEEVKLDETSLSKIFIKPDMFFVDKGNAEAAERFESLKARFGNKIQKTRYLNSWVDTVNRCINRSTTELLWVLNSELDYTNFDFDYYPNPWQMKMVHVFGTQWSHWGTTFMVNRESFPEDTKYIKIIEHLNNLNFVKEHRAVATACVYDIFVIDHGNDETANVVELLQQKAPTKNVTAIKYDESYLNTIRALVNRLPEKKEHYLWLCSSVCDYSKFDFSYICDPFARDNLHVFPSGRQKFGDTFLIDVNRTREIIGDLESLENYHKVNYNGTIKTERLPAPEIVTSGDTLVDTVKTMTRTFPYAVIMTEDNVGLPDSDYEPMNLWAPNTKNIIITSTGATRIIAPFEASEIDKELYDYPYIKRAPKLIKSNPMDIVFLSNGENCADEHYEHLLKITQGLPNRVVRVDGVNGRVAAYHAAAEASNTPWMFTVFAKLKVSPKFDFNWQPDRMQVPKHYIFHAKNPVNGLTYGHQAMIAYNKKLTLANEGRGLDFTLDDEHEIVPLISGTAHYNTDPFSTWRTAFREVLKLKADTSEESRVRLDAWLNKAEGDFSQYSIKGAVDADEYFDEVDGDFDALKLSYEWAWLRDKFDKM